MIKNENPPNHEISPKKRIELIRSHRVRFGLTAKLFTVMIIISLVPLVMFWGISLIQAKNIVRTEAQTHAHHIFTEMSRYVEEWFGEKARIIKELAQMDDIVSMDRKRQYALFDSIRKVYPEMITTFTFDADGNIIAKSDETAIEGFLSRQGCQDIMRRNKFSWRTLKDPSTKKPVLILAAPIIQKENRVGVIAGAIFIDNISMQALTRDAMDIGFAFLLGNKGTVTAHPIDTHGTRPDQLSWPPLIRAFKNDRFGSISFRNPEGKPVLAYVGKTTFGWGVAFQREEKNVSSLIDQLLSFAYLLLSITIVFVCIIAWFSGRALSRPIIKLTHAADRISIGELDMEIRTKRNDEIGDLSESIARLQESIRISIKRLRRKL